MEEADTMSIGALLTQTCQVQQLTTSASALGGVVNAWADRIASAPCLLNQRQSGEGVEFGKVTSRDGNILFIEYSASAAAIIESDRVIISSKTYEVTAQPYDAGYRNSHFQIELEEIEI